MRWIGRRAHDSVSLRFGAPRQGRTAIAVLALLALLSAAVGTTVAFGRGRPGSVEVVTRPAAQVPTFERPVTAPTLAPPSLPATTAPAAPKPAAPRPAPKPCPPAPAVPVTQTVAASALGSSVAVFDAPGGALVRRLPSPTRDHQRLHLRVVASQGDWLQVQMAERPNGVTGWIRSAEVETSVAPYRILVERCARRMTVFQAGRVVMREPVAVGKGSTPTPLGDFYVDFLEKWAPSSKYGPWLLSVSGFSEVYKTFGKGGVGQIGIHGTQARTSVGRPTSNGCVRMHNEAIAVLATMITPGTPVLIVA